MSRERRLESVAELLANFALSHGASTFSTVQARAVVAELLFGQRALWQAFREDLVTEEEVVNAIADRFATAAFRAVDSEPSSDLWAVLWRDLAGLLFRSA